VHGDDAPGREQLEGVGCVSEGILPTVQPVDEHHVELLWDGRAKSFGKELVGRAAVGAALRWVDADGAVDGLAQRGERLVLVAPDL